jgi:hypothetical protein
MAAVIAICAWAKHQHYKDRDPPWIKLYRDLLSAESWVLGTDDSRLVQVASILLAARYQNATPLNFALFRKVANLDLSESRFHASIDHLTATGFLEIQGVEEPRKQRASSVLATCTSEAEQSREEAEGEAEGSAEGREPSRKRSGQPPPSKAKLATRIPEGWQPSPDLIAYAEKELPNVDTAKLAESFTDYWQAAAGAKARKLDWDATWRTWVRRSCDRYPTKAQSRAMSPQIRIDANGRQISG